MANPENRRIKIFRKVISYIIYIFAFVLVCFSAGELQGALFSWSWGFSFKFNNSYLELFVRFPEYIFYGILQVIAAVLTIRHLSLRKLFYLSCIFAVLGAFITGLSPQIMNLSGWLSNTFLIAGRVIPYAVPVLILAIISRKKTLLKTESDIVPESAIEEETSSKIKSLYQRFWYVFDIILILLVLLYGTLSDPFGLIHYICGIYNRLGILFRWVFTEIVFLVPASFCLLVLVLRIFISWPKHISKKRRLLLFQLFVITLLVVYLGLPFVPIRPPGMTIYISGFSKYVSANTNIAEIRGWLDTLNPEDYVDSYYIFADEEEIHSKNENIVPDLQPQQWPEAITSLNPRYIRVSMNDNNEPQIHLFWGGGLIGTWGFVVGNENQITPESNLTWGGEYRREINHGVYVFYEIS